MSNNTVDVILGALFAATVVASIVTGVVALFTAPPVWLLAVIIIAYTAHGVATIIRAAQRVIARNREEKAEAEAIAHFWDTLLTADDYVEDID